MHGRSGKAVLKLLAVLQLGSSGSRPNAMRVLILVNTLLLAGVVILYLMRGRPLW